MRTDNTARADTPTPALLRECAAKTVDALLAELRRRSTVQPVWLSCKRPPFAADIASNNLPISLNNVGSRRKNVLLSRNARRFKSSAWCAADGLSAYDSKGERSGVQKTSTATPLQPQQDHRAADVLRLLQTTFPRDWEKHLRNLASRSLPPAELAEFTDQVFWRVKQMGIKDPATWLVTHRTLMEAPTAPLVPAEPEGYPVGAVASPIEPTRPHTCAAAADGEFIKKKNRRPGQTRKVVAFNLGQWMLSATPEIDDSVIDVQLCNLKQARFDNRQISAQDRLVTDLAALTCPVQLIWGGRGVLTFPSIRTRLDRCLAVRADLEAEILPVGGHWVQYECADEVNELLLRFHAPNSARKSGWQ